MSFFDWVQLILNQYGSMLVKGTGITILLAIVGTGVGFLIGLLIGVYKTIPLRDEDPAIKRILYKIFNFILSAYIEIFRSTPMMVQAMLFYYGIAMVFNIQLNILLSGLIIVSVNTGAYMSEIIRAGIQSIDPGQMEAARSLGMSKAQAMTKIIFPQAIKNILPAIGNECIALLKETSVAGYVAIVDLTRAATNIRNKTFDAVNPIILLAVIYLVLVVIMTKLLSVLERRLRRSDGK